MNFFYKIPAIIYRSFEDRGTDIPHFRALITMLSIWSMHIVHIILISKKSIDYIFPWSTNLDRGEQKIYGLAYFGLILTFLSIVFRESKLRKVEVSQKQIDRARTIIPVYLTFCILIMVVLLIRRGIENGTI